MENTQYFMSWKGMNDEGQQISYGAMGILFDSKEYEELQSLGLGDFALKNAKAGNKNVVQVHIIAFNQV